MATGKEKGPAQEHLDRLDSIFGPEYFEHARLVVTAARDIPGLMKVAHRLQAKINEGLGGVVEVIMEHIKHEWWVKLHETTMTVGLHKGPEVMDAQVTHIPEGIRVHPYKRNHMPTLEILLLWEDASGETRGHCLSTQAHPQIPCLDDVDGIFAQIEPYFAKRWVSVSLRLSAPIRGEFEVLEELDGTDECAPPIPPVGAGVDITVIACHPYGFARDQASAPATHVRECQPIYFRGVTDSGSRAKICFMPAEINKIQVAETGRFHGTETLLQRSSLRGVGDGATEVDIELTPKAMAGTTVHVFVLPRKLPSAEETDGIIDWAAEQRDPLPNATVEVSEMKAGAKAVRLKHSGNGAFCATAEESLPEGCVNLVVDCAGYEREERAVMLLVGENGFYIPLRRL